jgi:hypothetical protein
VSGYYEHVFTFHSWVGDSRSEGHASRWQVLFVGLVPLGTNARGGTLSLDTGFQQLTWGYQSQQDFSVPDVQYSLVDGGIGWRRDLLARWLQVALRAAVLIPVAEGDIATDTQYGPASGWGVEVDAGLTSRPVRWLWLHAGFEYSRIALSFASSGMRLAHSSADQWIAGVLGVGFAL